MKADHGYWYKDGKKIVLLNKEYELVETLEA